MILVKPSYKIVTPINESILEFIEVCGRTAYKSEEKITEESHKTFVSNLIKRGHESVIEHISITVYFICDRGVSHELVRHRLASFTQESTRYCDYSGGVTFIIPPWLDIPPCKIRKHSDILYKHDRSEYHWLHLMLNAEESYKYLINCLWTPQEARSVLPNSLKTEVIMTCNLREWRHIFKLRCANSAHPQMREIMIPLLNEMKTNIPIIFDDIEI